VGYADGGLAVLAIRPLSPEELAAWPSSWARRLAFGRPRPVFRIEARATTL
jgi:hypothetical protein